MIEKVKDLTSCPQCGRVACGRQEIVYFFGLRKMKDAIRVQSWCISCRSNALGVKNEMQIL